MGGPSKQRFAISEQPITETALAAALAFIHWGLGTGWSDPWSRIDGPTSQVIFQTGAGVVAIIASLAALGLATGGAGEQAKATRRLYSKQLRRNWRALLLTSAIAPLLCISAQIFAAGGADWAPYLFEFALIWTALRLARLSWLVDRLLKVQYDDEVDEKPAPQLGLSPDFSRRMGA